MHPIAAVEIEVSLWVLDEEVRKVLSTAQELDIAVIGYSPLGRGFLARKFKKPEDIPQDSFSAHMPRLQGEAFYENLKIVDKIVSHRMSISIPVLTRQDELAKDVGCEPAQLCLAYLLNLSPKLIPIPGTTNAQRAISNIESANVHLSASQIQAIDDALAKVDVKGERAPAALAAMNVRDAD